MSAPPAHFLECDFHTHTELSGEEQARGFTLERLFETAEGLGLRHVGCSEHWHAGTPPELFRRMREEIERLQPRFRVKVHLSAEIDVLNSNGDMAADPALAAGMLDYVSSAVSHYGAPGAEQLRPDIVDDTVAMIEALCRTPEVTMIMHPQIVYGRCVEKIDGVVGPDVYDAAMKAVAAAGKVIDFPSVDLSLDYLRILGFEADKLSHAAESFRNFARALVRRKCLLAPGSDAHNVLWGDGVTPWLGNSGASWELLTSAGFDEGRLWYFENR